MAKFKFPEIMTTIMSATCVGGSFVEYQIAYGSTEWLTNYLREHLLLGRRTKLPKNMNRKFLTKIVDELNRLKSKTEDYGYGREDDDNNY